MPKPSFDLLLAPLWQGQTHRGVAQAPELLARHLAGWNADRRYAQRTVSLVDAADSGRGNIQQISNLCQALSTEVQFSILRGRLPITLGGDHSLGVGSVSGSLQADPDTLVIWIDAHADVNTTKSSPSGSVHGMPVAVLLGLENELPFDWMKKNLKPSQLIYVATRDLDPGESITIQELGIRVYDMHTLRERGVGAVVREIQTYAKAMRVRSVHLSIDIDAWDPRFAAATGCHVAGGLNQEEGAELIRGFCQALPIRACDVVEMNPELGSHQEIQQTLGLATRIVTSVIEIALPEPAPFGVPAGKMAQWIELLRLR